MSKSWMWRSRKMPPEAGMYSPGGLGVVGGEPHRVDGTESAVLYEASRFRVSRVEASLEAYLERRSGGLDDAHHLGRFIVAERYRFLAESRDAGLDGGQDQGRVRRSRGGDDYGVGCRAENVFDPARLSTDLLGYSLGSPQVGVANEYLVHAGVAGQ